MSKLYDVIIAGAGPIGLFLACELRLAHASVLVLERDGAPKSPWKVAPLGRRGLNTGSAEAFYRRGLLNKLCGPSDRTGFLQTPGFRFGGHFAGIPLNANLLDLDRWKYRLIGPALVPLPSTIDDIESALTERADSLGVTILRGHGVMQITQQDNDSVTVEAGDGQHFRGKWLLGCDGGRSVIRKVAGFDFVGTDAKFTGYAFKGTLDHPDKLKPGFQPTKTGMYIFMPPDTMHLVEFDGAAFDRTQEITLAHLQGVFARVTGVPDVNITSIELVSSYTDRSKQAASYRKGHILLAGDAAHIHSPLGAQGLNLGLGDAINLGWKLAATIRRDAEFPEAATDFTLLDTYESERHAIATWVLEWTRAQVSTLQPDPFGSAIRTLVRDLIDTTDGTNLLLDRVWGLSLRYSLGEGDAYAHPVIGSSAPDFEFEDGSRLGAKLERGRGLLVDFGGSTALQELVVGRKYEARVDYIGVGAKDTRGLGALLVRPDGVVAWVTEEGAEPDVSAVNAALEKWFAF